MSDGDESGNACEAAGPAMVWEVGGGEVEMVEDDCGRGNLFLKVYFYTVYIHRRKATSYVQIKMDFI